MNAMNLVNRLPDFVELDGIRYEIYTDFRVWLYVDKLLLSADVSPAAKAAKMLSLCYKRRLPPDASAAVRLLLRFYCGGVREGNTVKKPRGSGKRIYDFEQDAELLYAAFLECYKIDLTEAKLHWWKFLALFRALDTNCRLCEVMRWRAVDLSQITDKRQKDFYRKMKRIYRLPERRGSEEADAALAEILAGAVEREEDENEEFRTITGGADERMETRGAGKWQ